VDEIINGGLHDYLDKLQNRMNQVGGGVNERYFARQMPVKADSRRKNKRASLSGQ
jgi:uncharacterized alpha-E superfamily protein